MDALTLVSPSSRANSSKVPFAIFLASCLVFVFSASAESATLKVCKQGCAFALIQDAINAAASGDKINVGAGTFFEHLSIKSKSIVIAGSGEDFTVVDGGLFGTTLSIGDTNSTEAGSLTLTGMTITHGSTCGILLFPESVLNLQSSIVISNLGGGIVNQGGTVTVGGSIIAHNKSPGLGGGIANTSEGRLTVSNSTIARNTASAGGGIFVDNLTEVTITGSTLSDNTANGSSAATIGAGEGGAIFVAPRDVHSPSGSLTMTSTALVDNHASSEGGGIFAQAFVPQTSVILGGNTPDNCGGGATCTPP